MAAVAVPDLGTVMFLDTGVQEIEAGAAIFVLALTVHVPFAAENALDLSWNDPLITSFHEFAPALEAYTFRVNLSSRHVKPPPKL